MKDCPVCGPAGEEGPCLAHSAPLLTPPTPDPRERGEDAWTIVRKALLDACAVDRNPLHKYEHVSARLDAIAAQCADRVLALRAPAPSEAVAWLIEKPQPGGVYWWHGKRHALAAINEDYNPDHFPSAIAYEFGPIAAEAVRFNSREDADVVIRRFPPQWRSVLIASEHMWVSAHRAPARGVTVTEAMVDKAARYLCDRRNDFVQMYDSDHPLHWHETAVAVLTAALTPDAEGGA